MTAEFALRLVGVTKDFGGLRAVDEVALALRPGERRALIGPNGAGKTTLFNLITGSLPVTAGTVRLFGRDVTSTSAHARAAQGLARTFQITNLFADLTVLENCLLAVQAQTPTRFAMLRPVGLSHGEQRQLEIALALAGRPRVLLLDEPTAGLSPGESRLMAGLLARLDPAITVLLIEHDMDIALELAAQVTVLHYGRVIADGSREQIRADAQVREIYLGA